jgi:hypothetical protein
VLLCCYTPASDFGVGYNRRIKMVLLPQSVEKLAQMGANIEITKEANYLPQSIEKIIQVAVISGASVTIDAGTYLPQSLERFVQIGKGKVTIRI